MENICSARFLTTGKMLKKLSAHYFLFLLDEVMWNKKKESWKCYANLSTTKFFFNGYTNNNNNNFIILNDMLLQMRLHWTWLQDFIYDII